MSHNGELLAARDEAASRRGFVLAVRGYDKRQVDQYVSQVDSAIATLAAERERALGHIQELNARLQQVQMELAEARDRPTRMDRASFRHLGPMVDQILALAEKQAEQIISTTSQRAANRQAEADKVLSDAEEKAAKTLRELDEELDARRTAEQKAHEERLAAAAAELAETRKLADRLRAEGEADHERAEQEAQRIKEQSAQQVERVRAESEALLEAAHARAEQEVAQRRADVEREIVDRRTEAAQKIAALHAQAQHHCAEVRRRGDEQAAAHQQQLAVVQREIQAHRQRLAQLQAELDAAEQRLAQARQEHATVEHEVTQMRHDLREVSQDLITERNRLAEVRQAAEAAEQHAKEVRARVRREAKRVAELAAAAVMAAATGGADTGEYPKVMARPAADRPVEPPAGAVVPGGPGMPTAGSGYASQDTGDAVPAAQQEPQPGELALAGDAE